MSRAAKPRADYGIDAPYIVRNLALGGLAALGVGVMLARLLRSRRRLARAALAFGVLSGAANLTMAGLMLWSSKRGKLATRDWLLDTIEWRGDERVLDVGPGRGLYLIGAAGRLPRGMAVGVDLWRAEDQSGNRPVATLANAAAEGVADRVVLAAGDAQRLPLRSASFDLIFSSMTLHNIDDRAGREEAVRELARVLKPGGRALIVDFWRTDEYAATLRACGFVDVERSGLLLSMFPTSRLVRGEKRAEP